MNNYECSQVNCKLYFSFDKNLFRITTTTKEQTTSKPSSPTPAPPDPCQEFIDDNCTAWTQNDPIIEVIHNIPIKDCDFFCNTIYADKCKFYIQDMEQKMCEIWKVEEDDYIHNCTKREGPVFPDLTADNKMPSSCASKNCSVSESCL